MSYYVKRKRGERGFWALFAAIVTFHLLFWGTIAFVALHFLAKVW